MKFFFAIIFLDFCYCSHYYQLLHDVSFNLNIKGNYQKLRAFYDIKGDSVVYKEKFLLLPNISNSKGYINLKDPVDIKNFEIQFEIFLPPFIHNKNPSLFAVLLHNDFDDSLTGFVFHTTKATQTTEIFYLENSLNNSFNNVMNNFFSLQNFKSKNPCYVTIKGRKTKFTLRYRDGTLNFFYDTTSRFENTCFRVKKKIKTPFYFTIIGENKNEYQTLIEVSKLRFFNLIRNESYKFTYFPVNQKSKKLISNKIDLVERNIFRKNSQKNLKNFAKIIEVLHDFTEKSKDLKITQSNLIKAVGVIESREQILRRTLRLINSLFRYRFHDTEIQKMNSMFNLTLKNKKEKEIEKLNIFPLGGENIIVQPRESRKDLIFLVFIIIILNLLLFLFNRKIKRLLKKTK